MSTAHCNLKPHIDRFPCLLLTLLMLAYTALTPALAIESDRNQQISVSAEHFSASRNGATILTGNVVITQGTLKASADKGTAHRDAAGKVNRIVLEGKPAHLQQKMDRGGLMHARANSIDYQVGGNTITLTGNAHVQQPGQGTFDAEHLVYNSASGAMQGSGGRSGQVHMTLEPRNPAASSSSGKP